MGEINVSRRGRIADKFSTALDVVWAMAAEGRLQPTSPTAGVPVRSSGEIAKLEGAASFLASGIRFYPSSSNTAVKIGEFKDEDGTRDSSASEQYLLQHPPPQPYGLDPSAIFKKVTEADTKKLAPEQSITLFALRLAMLEKSASGIGALSFIWASTIILGGFAPNINPVDFMVIAAILVTEGTRIFSRSRELEWQHLASKSTDSSLAYTKERGMNLLKSYGGRDHTNSKAATGTGTDTVNGVVTREDPTPSSEPPGQPEPEPGAIEVTVEFEVDRSYCSDGSQEDLENCNEEKKPHPIANLCLPSLLRLRTENQVGEKKKRTVPVNEIEFGMGKGKGPGNGMYIEVPRRSPPNSKGSTMRRSPIQKDASGKDQKSSLNNVNPENFKRTWSSQVVPVLPATNFSSILSTRVVSAILYWVQLTSAIICLVLSCWRISLQEFNPAAVERNDAPVNLYTSLNIFYSLALAEALMFLLERGYWEYKMNYKQLIVQVNNKAELGDENMEVMKQFFYEVYKKCIEGSMFDGLEMDLVEYSLTLVQSDNSYAQLGGLRVLRKIVDRFDGFSADALRRIGTAPGVIERLVEMLSWRSPHQEDIRQEVAGLICRAVRYSKNCIRVTAVPGSMEGIVSLVKSDERERIAASLVDKSVTVGPPLTSVDQTIADLRLDGLRILVAQAKDAVNLLKIGEMRGLVPTLVSFIAVKDVQQFKRMEGTELKTFKKVLRLLAMLAAAPNVFGTILRPGIARVVSGIASMRDILEFGDCHPQLQWMAIEILTNLALDDDIRRAIGSTGGIIRNLFTLYIRNLDGSGALFATEANRKVEKAVSKRAGDALTFLSVQNRSNCFRMMDLQDGNGTRTFIPALLNVLHQHQEQTICAAKILCNLMDYGTDFQKRDIAVCAPRVMTLVMRSSSQKMQEAVICLAPRVLAVLDESVYNRVLENVDMNALVQRLLRNLEHNSQTSVRFPRIRRHSIEFILALIKRDHIFLEEFMREGVLETKLVQTLDSICEVENFVTFSGAEGLTRHAIPMEDLVHQSLHELRILVQERERN